MIHVEESDLNPYGRRVLRCLRCHLETEDEVQAALRDLLQRMGGDRELYLPVYRAARKRAMRRRARTLLARGESPEEALHRTDLCMRTIRRIEGELDAQAADDETSS